MKTLVLYCFHEYNDRVKQFIKTGIFKDPTVDFMIICNHPTLKINIPSDVHYMNRENIGYDFGAWSDAVLNYNVEKYDYFIFLNSSVSGPYVSGKWTNMFLKGLQGNVKLYGCTINAMACKYKKMQDPLYRSHVQSYLFCMDKKTLAFLIEKDIFSKNYVRSFNDAIIYKEVRMSRVIIKNGWNIGSRLPYYQGVDFTFQKKRPHDYPTFLGDVMNEDYENKLWTKEQLVFVKGNRIQCKKNCKKTKKTKPTDPIVPKTIRLPYYLKE